MKLKNREIFNAREPLAKLLTEKFPVKISYELAKLIKKLNEQLDVIEEVRLGLIKSYGKPDPKNPTQMQVTEENTNFEKFVSELNELFDQEIEIVFSKINLPETVRTVCDKCNHTVDKPLEVEPSVLLALEKFLEVK